MVSAPVTDPVLVHVHPLVLDCLRHAGDPSALGRSPLAGWQATGLRIEPAVDRPTHLVLGRAVRALLAEAIDLLRPTSPRDIASAAWRRYLILAHGFRGETSNTYLYTAVLLLSKSEFYRERQEAVSELARTLVELEHCAVREQLALAEGPLHGPSTGAFVGRGEELARCLRRLAGGGAAAITGLPGSGKSALAVALAERCHDGQVLWLRFVPGQLDDLPGAWQCLAAQLARVGQERLLRLRALEYVRGAPPSAEQRWAGLVSDLAAGSFLLCLDNVEVVAEDPRLQGLFGRLLAEPVPARVLFVGRAPSATLRRLLPTPLGGLDAGELGMWLRLRGLPSPSDRVVERLQRRTDGHPGFLELLLEGCCEVHPRQRPNAGDLADAVESDPACRLRIERCLFDDALAGLAEPELRLMRLAAVGTLRLWDDASRDEVARAVGADPVPVAERLAEQGWLRLRGSAGALCLPPLVLDYLRLTTAPAARRRLLGRVAHSPGGRRSIAQASSAPDRRASRRLAAAAAGTAAPGLS